MKIKIEFTVEIDPVAWEMEYGTPRNELRESVRSYVKHSALEQFDGLGVALEKGGE